MVGFLLAEGMKEGANERVEVDVCEDYKNDTYDKDQNMAYIYRIMLFPCGKVFTF